MTNLSNERGTDISTRQERMKKNRDEHLSPLLKIGAIGLGGVAVIGASVGYAVHESQQSGQFSDETTTYVAPENGSLYDSLGYIEGIEDVSLDEAADYVAHMPANIPALEDGLQVGEAIVIPESYDQ